MWPRRHSSESVPRTTFLLLVFFITILFGLLSTAQSTDLSQSTLVFHNLNQISPQQDTAPATDEMHLKLENIFHINEPGKKQMLDLTYSINFTNPLYYYYPLQLSFQLDGYTLQSRKLSPSAKEPNTPGCIISLITNFTRERAYPPLPEYFGSNYHILPLTQPSTDVIKTETLRLSRGMSELGSYGDSMKIFQLDNRRHFIRVSIPITEFNFIKPIAPITTFSLHVDVEIPPPSPSPPSPDDTTSTQNQDGLQATNKIMNRLSKVISNSINDHDDNDNNSNPTNDTHQSPLTSFSTSDDSTVMSKHLETIYENTPSPIPTQDVTFGSLRDRGSVETYPLFRSNLKKKNPTARRVWTGIEEEWGYAQSGEEMTRATQLCSVENSITVCGPDEDDSCWKVWVSQPRVTMRTLKIDSQNKVAMEIQFDDSFADWGKEHQFSCSWLKRSKQLQKRIIDWRWDSIDRITGFDTTVFYNVYEPNTTPSPPEAPPNVVDDNSADSTVASIISNISTFFTTSTTLLASSTTGSFFTQQEQSPGEAFLEKAYSSSWDGWRANKKGGYEQFPSYLRSRIYSSNAAIPSRSTARYSTVTGDVANEVIKVDNITIEPKDHTLMIVLLVVIPVVVGVIIFLICWWCCIRTRKEKKVTTIAPIQGYNPTTPSSPTTSYAMSNFGANIDPNNNDDTSSPHLIASKSSFVNVHSAQKDNSTYDYKPTSYDFSPPPVDDNKANYSPPAPATNTTYGPPKEKFSGLPAYSPPGVEMQKPQYQYQE